MGLPRPRTGRHEYNPKRSRQVGGQTCDLCAKLHRKGAQRTATAFRSGGGEVLIELQIETAALSGAMLVIGIRVVAPSS